MGVDPKRIQDSSLRHVRGLTQNISNTCSNTCSITCSNTYSNTPGIIIYCTNIAILRHFSSGEMRATFVS